MLTRIFIYNDSNKKFKIKIQKLRFKFSIPLPLSSNLNNKKSKPTKAHTYLLSFLTPHPDIRMLTYFVSDVNIVFNTRECKNHETSPGNNFQCLDRRRRIPEAGKVEQIG
jgi:hypothetical protein